MGEFIAFSDGTLAKVTERTENERDAAIKAIRAALKKRSGKVWSVTGGRGTAWGWIKIDAPPARCTWRHFLKEGLPDAPGNYEERDNVTPNSGHMSPAERVELAALLGLDTVHCQGVSIPASGAYREEYMARAKGWEPKVIGTQYWD